MVDYDDYDYPQQAYDDDYGYDDEPIEAIELETKGQKRKAPDKRPAAADLHWSRRHGVATWLIILVSLGLFALEMNHQDWVFEPLIVNPMFGPSSTTLIEMGARYRPSIVDEGELHRLLLAIFLHAGVATLCVNCALIHSWGSGLEKQVGSLRVLIVYLGGGFVGNVYSAVFEPNLLGAGANGAMFGLLGAEIAEFQHNKENYSKEGRTRYVCGRLVFIVIGLVVGVVPYVDNFELVFGCLGGYFLALAVFYGSALSRITGKVIQKTFCALTGCVLFMVLLIGGTVVLLEDIDADEMCSSCRYLSCVESPWWDCPWNTEACVLRILDNGTQVCE